MFSPNNKDWDYLLFWTSYKKRERKCTAWYCMEWPLEIAITMTRCLHYLTRYISVWIWMITYFVGKRAVIDTGQLPCAWLRIEYRSDDVTKKLFLDFSILDTMCQWSMMKNIHSPNWVGIDSWGPEIWPHEYLISPMEISVNWSGSKQLWTRPIYTDFSGAN